MRTVLLGLLSLGLIAAAVGWQSKDEAPRPPAAAAEGKWYKGNLHTHTFWSDGDDFPEMVADWYRKEGYHFLALTDHNVLAEGQRWAGAEKLKRPEALTKYLKRFGPEWVERREGKAGVEVRLKPLAEFRSLLEEPGRFLLIPAEEVTHSFAKRPVHMNAINLRDAIKPLNGDSVAETIRANHRAVADQAKKAGRRILTFLNHPNFHYAVTTEDMVAAEEVRFFEVYNGHPTVNNRGKATHPGTDRMWDVVLALRLGKLKLPPVYGLGTDDAHAYHAFGLGKSNPGRAWVMVRATHLTAEGVVSALEAGRFYGSTGVELEELSATKEALRLKVKPKPGVRYRTQFVATLKGASLESKPGTENASRIYSDDVGKVVAEAEGLEAAYSLTGKELYVRARVVSTRAHPNPAEKGDVESAWTQPVVPE